MMRCEAIQASTQKQCRSPAKHKCKGRNVCGRHIRSARFVGDSKATQHELEKSRNAALRCIIELTTFIRETQDQTASLMVETVRWQSWLRGPGRPHYRGPIK